MKHIESNYITLYVLIIILWILVRVQSYNQEKIILINFKKQLGKVGLSLLAALCLFSCLFSRKDQKQVFVFFCATFVF
jgi:hypothetical protein